MVNQYRRRSAWALICLALLLGGGGCGETQRSDVEYLERGKAQFQQKKYRAGILELKNALQQNPANTEARWLLARGYLKIGDGASAEKEFEKTHELGVPLASVAVGMAKAIYIQRDFRRLIERFASPVAAIRDADRSTLLTYLGRAYLELEEMAAAEQAFSEAYELESDNPHAIIGMARMALARDNSAAAEQYLAAAATAANADGGVWLAIGEVKLGLKNYAAAEEAFQKAIDQGDSDVLTYTSVKARMGIVRTKLALHKTDEAKRHLEVLENVNNKHFFVVYFRGVIAYREGLYEAALSDFQTIEKREPGYKSNILMLGATHLALGNDQQAESYLTRFLKLEPGFVPARLAMASLQLNEYQPQEAIDILGQAPDADKHSDVLSLMADASVQIGDIEQSSLLIRKAVAQDPEAQQLKIKLASSELLLGNPKKAIDIIQTNFSEESLPFPAAMVEIDAYLKLQDVPGAMRRAEALIERHPDDPRGYNLRGTLHMVEARYAEAGQDFELALGMDREFAAAWLNLGKLAGHTGTVQSAKEYFQKAVEMDPGLVPAMLELAAIAEREGRIDERTQWLEQVRAANPRAIEPRVLLARYYISVGKNTEVMRISDELTDIDADHPETLKLKGAIAAGQGALEESYDFYRRLVELAPSADNLLRQAKAEVRLERYEHARKTLAKVLKADADSVTAHSMVASIDIKDGRYKAALQRANQLQQQFPDNVAGFFMAGDVYNAQQRYAAAAKSYAEAARIKPAGVLVGKQAWALRQQGDTRAAEAVLQQWLDTNPQDMARALMLANMYELEGEFERAIERYRWVLKREPRHHVAQNQLALILDQMGRSDEALTLAEQAYNHSGEKAIPTDTLGWLLVKSGAVNRGLALLERAVRAAPDMLAVQYHYAYALNAVGETAKAKAVLERILERDEAFEERGSAEALLDSF